MEPWARAMSAAFGGLVPGALDAPEVFLRLRDKYEVKPERQESLLKWLAAGSSDARFVRGWLTGDPGCLTRKKGKDDPRKLYLRLLERMDNDRSAKRAPVDVREAKPEDYSGGWGK